MELKKTPNNGDAELDLTGDGVLEEPKRKDPIRKKYSDDYSRTGTNSGYVDNVIEEWDENIEKNSFHISAREAEEALAKTTQEKKADTARFLRVSEVLMYAAFAFVIVMLVLLITGDKLDILYNLGGVKISLAVLYAYLIIDAILVYNNIIEKKATLFIIALLVPIAYPPYRNKLANDSAGFGILCSILFVFAFVMTFVTFGQTYTKYGNLIKIENNTTRHSAINILEQNDENGKKYINYLPKWITIEDVEVSNKKNDTLVTFSGTGKIDYTETLNPVTDNRVPTTIVFTNKNDGSGYKISAVTIKDNKLSKSELEQYILYIEGK